MDLLFRQLFSADLLPYHEVTALTETVAAIATPALDNTPLVALGAGKGCRGRLRFGPGRSRAFRCRFPCLIGGRITPGHSFPLRPVRKVEFHLEPLPQLQSRRERLARLRGKTLDPRCAPFPEQLLDLLLRQLETRHRLPDGEPAAFAVAAASVCLRGLDDLPLLAQRAPAQPCRLRVCHPSCPFLCARAASPSPRRPPRGTAPDPRLLQAPFPDEPDDTPVEFPGWPLALLHLLELLLPLGGQLRAAQRPSHQADQRPPFLRGAQLLALPLHVAGPDQLLDDLSARRRRAQPGLSHRLGEAVFFYLAPGILHRRQ